MARVIRDTPADCISLKLGINVHNLGSLNMRTFAQNVIGYLQTIRDGHSTTPILVISPIYSDWREEAPFNLPDLGQAASAEVRAGPLLLHPSLPMMRAELERVVELLRKRGDTNLHYLSGLELFGEEDVATVGLPDGLHPNGDGYELIGQRFAKLAFGEAGLLLPGGKVPKK